MKPNWWTVTRIVGIGLGVAVGVALGFAAQWALRPVGGESPPAAVAADKPASDKTVWTCAMHPNIQLPRPGLCPICHMELTPLDKSAGPTVSLREISLPPEAVKLMEIETSMVQRQPVAKEIRMVGKVEYDETRLANITAWVGGRLDRLFVNYTGVAVRKGDHMVELYSPQLLAAQEELIQALRARRNVKPDDSSLIRESTEATWKAARDKLRLLGLTEEQVAQVEKSEKATDRVIIYAPMGGIVVQKEVVEGAYVETGTRIYSIADLTQVWVLLDAYESDLAWLRYGQLVEFTSVAYPGESFTGRISFIDPILNNKTRTVRLRVNVTNPQMKLKPQMFVHGLVRAHLSADGVVPDSFLQGKWISPMHPEIMKDQPGECDICQMPLVRAELLGYCALEQDKPAQPLVIPVSAALITGTRAIVYVEVKGGVDGKPAYVGREIVLGPRAGDLYVVAHGLREGERVVTRGNVRLDAALQIAAKPSMMTPDGAGASPGHQHGPAGGQTPADMGTPKPLPALFAHQVAQMADAAGRAARAAAGDNMTDARAAFDQVERALRAVESAGLDPHSELVWKEYSMRMGNDSFEGRQARTLGDARRAADSLQANLNQAIAQIGLPRSHAGHQGPKQASPAVLAQLQPLYSAYVRAGKALAGDDLAKTKAALADMGQALAGVDMKLFAGEDHDQWMKVQSELNRLLERMGQAKEFPALRELYLPLSQQVLLAARRFGHSATLYLMNCPMAFNNQGGQWISDGKEVLNPYFGSAMLQCGEVTEVLAPAAQTAPGSRATPHINP